MHQFLDACNFGAISPLCAWYNDAGFLVYIILFLAFAILISIFVIDIENQIIPDTLTFYLFVLALIVTLFYSGSFYSSMLTGFMTSLFLLILHLVTKGKGMGLGDVKLAIPVGMLLGWPAALVWVFLSFILGAAVGIILILFKKAKFGKRISFGPFLVVSFFISLYYGQYIFDWLFWPI
jgi:prepilin signal peptidase PulO-like enzyme (type II secretory pathway)